MRWSESLLKKASLGAVWARQIAPRSPCTRIGARLCAAEALAFHCWARTGPLFWRPPTCWQPRACKGCQQELATIDEAELTQREGDVLLRVVGDTGYTTLYL